MMNGAEWDGMGWGWDGMGWNGMRHKVPFHCLGIPNGREQSFHSPLFGKWMEWYELKVIPVLPLMTWQSKHY